MSAVANWKSLRQQIIDAAAYHPTNEAHLEATEIAQFVEEAGYVDILESLVKSLTTVDDKPRELICRLWAECCKHGEDMPMSKAMDLLSAMRAAQLDVLTKEAQEMVDEVLS